MKLPRALAVVALLSGPAAAQDFDTDRRAEELGTVIASEAFCGLTLSASGIEAWIAANVAPDDLAFAGRLSFEVDMGKYRLDDMSASAKVAHCAATRQAAAAMGLTE